MIKSDQQDMLLRLCDHYEGKTTNLVLYWKYTGLIDA